MKHSITFLCLMVSILLIFSNCTKKDEFPVLKGPYLGQKPPGLTPEVFAPGIVTTIHHEHSRIEFSKNGKEMFWEVWPVDTNYKTTGGRPLRTAEQNIWHSRIFHGKWTKPSILDIIKTSGVSSPVFSANGEMFYFRIFEPDVDPPIRPQPSQLWKVSYDNGKWGAPIHENDLLPRQERKTCWYFTFAENGNLYFDYGGLDEKGVFRWDIYVSEFQYGEYLNPVKMSDGINDGRVNLHPWIAPDESYIIYSSNRDGGFGGHGDLYIHFRNKRGNWSGPINMGGKINTEMYERFPSVSPDRKFLFFVRDMPETFGDIYWVDAKIIEELKPKEIK